MDSKEKAILDKVKELMLKYGIKSLTMDDVAQQLGISKKTLYQVVENKADLVHKIIKGAISLQQEGLQCVIDESTDAIDQLSKIYRHNSEMFKRLNPSLMYELRKYYPESWELFENFRNNFIFNCVSRNLENGIKHGLYRADINTAIIAKLYTVRSLEVFNAELFPPDQYQPTVVLREMFIYHIRGIASDKGLQYLEKIDFSL